MEDGAVVLYLLAMCSWRRLSLERGTRKCGWQKIYIFCTFEREIQGSVWHGRIYSLQKIPVDLNAAQGGLQVCLCTSYVCVLKNLDYNSQQQKRCDIKCRSNIVQQRYQSFFFASLDLNAFPLRYCRRECVRRQWLRIAVIGCLICKCTNVCTPQPHLNCWKWMNST